MADSRNIRTDKLPPRSEGDHGPTKLTKNEATRALNASRVERVNRALSEASKKVPLFKR
jgi:hypothetical protein